MVILRLAVLYIQYTPVKAIITKKLLNWWIVFKTLPYLSLLLRYSDFFDIYLWRHKIEVEFWLFIKLFKKQFLKTANNSVKYGQHFSIRSTIFRFFSLVSVIVIFNLKISNQNFCQLLIWRVHAGGPVRLGTLTLTNVHNFFDDGLSLRTESSEII